MSEYPKQLIQEISEHLDPAIIEFYSNTYEDMDYPIDSITSLVELTMGESFGGFSSKEELGKIYTSLKHNRQRMRTRWFKTMANDLEVLSPNDKKYPFHNLYIAKTSLKKTEWTTLYGNVTFDERVSQLLKQAKEWMSDPNSLLIHFPAIDSFSSKKVYKALCSDILLSIYNFIDEEYDGSIENYFLPYPKDLMNYPLFFPGKKKLDLKPTADKRYVDEYTFEMGVLTTTIDSENFTIGDQLSSLNQTDLHILAMSIQNLDINFFKTRKSRVKKSTLVKILHTRPGKKHYDALIDHCLKLSKLNFTIEFGDKSKAISFNLLDTVDTTDPEYIEFTYGTTLYNSIIHNQLTNIKSSQLRSLEQPLCNILLHPLFSERIICFLDLTGGKANSEIDICKSYPYSYFSSCARFPKRNKLANMDLIEQALKEFLDKRILISSYSRLKNNEGFFIHFFPLTDEEIADLSYERFPIYDTLEDYSDSDLP